MEKRIKIGSGQKSKTKENSTLRAQRLFGFVKNVYGRIRHPPSEKQSLAYITAAMLKEHKLQVEQERAEATEFTLGRKLAIY